MPIEFEIANKNVTPPQGWSYTQPESGATFKSHDYRSWTRDILSHRKANGYPVGDEWEEELISDACKQNSHWNTVCKRVGVHQGSGTKKLGFKHAMAFLKTLRAFVEQGGLYVEQEEADRRAEICSRCPKNKPVGFSCGACAAGLLGLLRWLLGKRTVFAASEIENCSVCLCDLKAAVWFPVEAQKAGLTEPQIEEFKKLDSFCWKAQGL